MGPTPFFFGGLFFHFFAHLAFLPKASRMSYHTTINGNQRELKSQNPFYWIGVTPHVAHRQKQQGPTTTATRYVVSLSQARQRVKLGNNLLLK